MLTQAPILILGMHRSGTSCLTGCLEEAGLFLGDVNTQAGFNKKGNRENRAIMDLHERVLERNGYRWDSPPSRPIDWLPSETDQLRTLIAAYPETTLWGTKDPRAVLVMDQWLALCAPRFIGTFRHPLEVAASLMNRAEKWNQSLSLETALGLWETYNRRMLDIRADIPFDIIRFDVDGHEYETNLRIAADNLGLNIPQPLKFFDPNLHNQHSNAPIPDALKPLWERLLAYSL